MAEYRETVRANEFNKKFKNPLRDYYSYGFGKADISSTDPKWKEMKDSWNRLNAILDEYIEWSVPREETSGENASKSLKAALKKAGMFANVESETLPCNPIHKIYRFAWCEEDFPAFFIHMLSAMSDMVRLRIMEDTDGFESIYDVLELGDCRVRSAGAESNAVGRRNSETVDSDSNAVERLKKVNRVPEIECLLKKRREELEEACLREKKGQPETAEPSAEREGISKTAEQFVERDGAPKTAVQFTEKSLRIGKQTEREQPSAAVEESERIRTMQRIRALQRIVQKLEKEKKESELWSTAELMCFYTLGKDLFSGDNATHNNKLEKLKEIGFLLDQRRGEIDNRQWKCSEVTLGRLLEQGEKASCGFAERFRLAMQFYSMYFPLGEIGTRLLDRMGPGAESPFRFQHAYFMQAAYDFNLIDILFAIENRKWCRFRYAHGTDQSEDQILCRPLELRISVLNGRMHLMEYEPLDRACKSLRVDFIESTDYYSTEQICNLLHCSEKQLEADVRMAEKVKDYAWGVSTGTNASGNAASRLKAKYRVDIRKGCEALGKNRKETLRQELERLSEVQNIQEENDALLVTVGNLPGPDFLSSTLKKCEPVLLEEVYEDGEIRTEHVEFVIDDDPDAYNRLVREKRRGTVTQVKTSRTSGKGSRLSGVESGSSGKDSSSSGRNSHPSGKAWLFRADVLDAGELRPWIRSFYGNNVRVKGISRELGFRVADDIKNMKEQNPLPPKQEEKRTNYVWGIPFDKKKMLDVLASNDRISQTSRPHEMLFQGLFSVYCFTFAEIIAKVSALGDKEPISEEVLWTIVKEVSENQDFLAGYEMNEIQKDFSFEKMKDGHFIKKEGKTGTYHPRYRCEKGISFYRDIVPLSELEIRWLLSVLEDPFFTYFLTDSEAEMGAIKKALAVDGKPWKPLPFDKICFYDANPANRENACGEREIFQGEGSEREPEILCRENTCGEREIFQELMLAMTNHHPVFLEGSLESSIPGKGEYHPIFMQYSKQENRFYVLLQCGEDCSGEEFRSVPLNCITRVERKDSQFDAAEARKALDAFRARTMKSVEVEFTGEMRRGDRILSEFSPWKKKCTFDDRKTGYYQLTIYYHQDEEEEIANRLMRHGSYIHFKDPEHDVCKIIRKKLGEDE